MEKHDDFRDLVCIRDPYETGTMLGVLDFEGVAYRLISRSPRENTVRRFVERTVVQVDSTDLARAQSLLDAHRNARMGIPMS